MQIYTKKMKVFSETGKSFIFFLGYLFEGG